MKSIKYIASILLLLIFSTACKEDLPTEPISALATNAGGQPIPKFTDIVNLNGVLATIFYEFDSGIASVPAVELALGYAQFGKMVNGGSVSINNNELTIDNQSEQVFYLKPGTGSIEQLRNVNFDGSLHKWRVSGNGDIPSFEGEVKSPTKFDVTVPKNKSIISKLDGITINWTISGSSDEKILINLISISDSKIIVTDQDLDNTGSYKIESSKISSVSGQVMVQVVKYRYSEVSANNKSYLIVSEVVKSLTLTVQ